MVNDGEKGISNGNGSLMRILPVALRFAAASPDRLLDFAQRASAITHRHLRSQMACGFYCLVVAGLLRGQTPSDAHRGAVQVFHGFYQQKPFADQLPHFSKVLDHDLGARAAREIPSSGYVVDTLTAGLWCLLTRCIMPSAC